VVFEINTIMLMAICVVMCGLMWLTLTLKMEVYVPLKCWYLPVGAYSVIAKLNVTAVRNSNLILYHI
jgi:hypothetical protein